MTTEETIFAEAVRLGSAEAEAAFSWSCGADWELAPPLARKLFNYLRTEGRSDEKVLVLKRLEAAAEQCGDWGTLDFARHELSWISGSPWTRASTTADQLHFDFVV